jgi:HSP20 family protein
MATKQPPAALATDWFGNRLAQFQTEFNSILDRFWNDWPAIDNQWFRGSLGWGLDMDEAEKEYVVRAEAPGFEADDFDVQVRGSQLLIRAERKKEQKSGQNGSLYQYGKYERMIPLPAGARIDGITARYHSGVLELHLPKGEEVQGKRIAVKAN